MSAVPDPRLDGAVAIVTGAGRGIGRAIAWRLGAEGARVVVDDIGAEGAERTCAELRADGIEAVPVAADVSVSADVDRLFDVAVDAFGTVDVLVNHAGRIDFARHFLEVDEDWWDLVLTNNLKSVYLCSFRGAWQMARRGGGVIINTSSGGAQRAHRGNAPYDAAKGGIEALTRALALDLAPYGVRVNAVAPGAIDVSPPGALGDDERAARGASIPLGRLGTPDDLTGAVAFLASDDARYVTGQVLAVDGGLLAQQRAPQVDIFGLDRFPQVEPAHAPS
jgi:NAD(P)-dependent dehydrogenase (short-subunit alcohol dehydrogenase family)